jgi:hypothetical protein
VPAIAEFIDKTGAYDVVNEYLVCSIDAQTSPNGCFAIEWMK